MLWHKMAYGIRGKVGLWCCLVVKDGKIVGDQENKINRIMTLTAHAKIEAIPKCCNSAPENWFRGAVNSYASFGDPAHVCSAFYFAKGLSKVLVMPVTEKDSADAGLTNRNTSTESLCSILQIAKSHGKMAWGGKLKGILRNGWEKKRII